MFYKVRKSSNPRLICHLWFVVLKGGSDVK